MRVLTHVARAILMACAILMPAISTAQTASPVAQPPAQITLYELVLRDGSKMYGSIDREDEVEVAFRTQAGATMTVRRSDVRSLRRVTGLLVNGEFQRSDPNKTRLFFAPTGHSLKKGETYLGVYEFLMPFVQVGVTDRFSIGGGTPLVFGIDEWERPFWITPKLQVVRTTQTQVSVGVLHAFDTDGDGGGVAYVVGTHGGAAGSFTIGGGLGYATGGGQSGVVMVGGERTVRRNMKIITENYIWKGGNGIASAGIRFFGGRLSADLALGIPIGAGEFFAFPIVNFVYVF